MRFSAVGVPAFAFALASAPRLGADPKTDEPGTSNRSGASAPTDAPAPTLETIVVPHGPNATWRLRIRNDGDEPVLLATDPRLIWFEVDVPGKKGPVTCRVPEDLFPHRVDADFVVPLRRGQAYALDFDPRLYCYAAGGQSVLVPGAFVKPHYGWPPRTKTVWKRGRKVEEKIRERAPFAVESADEAKPVQSRKSLPAEPFALRSNYADWAATKIRGEDEAPEDATFALTMGRGSDAEAERTATVEVTLKNVTDESVAVYFRRELLTFEVVGVDGLRTCNPEPRDREPDRMAFLRFGKKLSMTFTSRLVELCPNGTFDRPGLYLVNARFDAKNDGAKFRIDAFVGRVESTKPAPIRVRTGDKPFVDPPERKGNKARRGPSDQASGDTKPK